MNLNKTQIEALTDKFYSEIKDKYNEINSKKRIAQLEKYRPNYEKGIKLLKENSWLTSIDITVKKDESVNLELNYSFEDYTNDYLFTRLLEDNKEISKNGIKNDIILATIDSTSIDDIMNTLKKKYK